jgi:hypothetical protein
MVTRAGRQLAILLTMTIGLALFAAYGPHSKPGPDAERLTTLLPTQITQIRLERPGRDPIALKHDGNKWRVTAPILARANPIRAGALASLAGASSNVVYARADVKAKALGLGATALVLRLNDTILRIGTREEVRGLRYVQNAGRVFLLQDRFYHHVSATTAGYVDLALFDRAKRIVSIKTHEISLESAASGLLWQPRSAFPSADQAATWLATWRNISALVVSFTDYSAKWHPAATVIFETGKSERLVYRSERGRVWIARPETDFQYEIPTSHAKTLGLLEP